MLIDEINKSTPPPKPPLRITVSRKRRCCIRDLRSADSFLTRTRPRKRPRRSPGSASVAAAGIIREISFSARPANLSITRDTRKSPLTNCAERRDRCAHMGALLRHASPGRFDPGPRLKTRSRSAREKGGIRREIRADAANEK